MHKHLDDSDLYFIQHVASNISVHYCIKLDSRIISLIREEPFMILESTYWPEQNTRRKFEPL